MKKLIALALVLVMAVSMLAACRASGQGSQESTAAPSTNGSTEAPTETQAPETQAPETEAPETQAPAGETMGQTLLKDFQARMGENPSISLQDLADALLTNPVIPFMPATMALNDGDYLPGFDSDITGFSECVQFGPMIGSIPFMGYLFRLADGADVDGFIQTLEDNANLRWQICVTADELIVDQVDGTVFFVMAPYNFEET